MNVLESQRRKRLRRAVRRDRLAALRLKAWPAPFAGTPPHGYWRLAEKYIRRSLSTTDNHVLRRHRRNARLALTQRIPHPWEQRGLRCWACGRVCEDVTGGPSADDQWQACRWIVGVLDVHVSDTHCHAAVACWECFWRTEPGQGGIRAEDWDALQPRVPSSALPVVTGEHNERWDPARYAWPEMQKEIEP